MEPLRYGEWVTMHGYEGDVYLERQQRRDARAGGGDGADRGVDVAVRGMRKASAVPLQILPAPNAASRESYAGSVVLPGAAFVLAAEDGTFLQRTERIGSDRPNAPPHESCRFALGFAAQPTQRMVVQPAHCANPAAAAVAGLPLSSPIGITICGDARDPTSPDNDRARLITLRSHDEPNVVVQWWAGHERISLEPAAPLGQRSTAARSAASPASVQTVQDGQLGQADEPIARRLRSSGVSPVR